MPYIGVMGSTRKQRERKMDATNMTLDDCRAAIIQLDGNIEELRRQRSAITVRLIDIIAANMSNDERREFIDLLTEPRD